MSDALENLKKLPPECAATIAGQKVWIVRGAKEPKPLSTPMSIAERNRQLGVTDAQVQAMIVGVTLGWDQDGADPDTHARVLNQETGPYSYEFASEVTVEVHVSAHTEGAARELASEKLLQFLRFLQCGHETEFIKSFGLGDTLDLIETEDPNA